MTPNPGWALSPTKQGRAGEKIIHTALGTHLVAHLPARFDVWGRGFLFHSAGHMDGNSLFLLLHLSPCHPSEHWLLLHPGLRLAPNDCSCQGQLVTGERRPGQPGLSLPCRPETDCEAWHTCTPSQSGNQGMGSASPNNYVGGQE